MARSTVRNAYVSSWLSVNERPTSVSMPPTAATRRVRRAALCDDRPRLDGGAREWDGLALERAERGEGAAGVHLS